MYVAGCRCNVKSHKNIRTTLRRGKALVVAYLSIVALYSVPFLFRQGLDTIVPPTAEETASLELSLLICVRKYLQIEMNVSAIEFDGCET